MKKFLSTTAILCLLFTACNKDKTNKQDPNDPSQETVKKLPSKITMEYVYNGQYIYDTLTDTTTFQYDDENRLVRMNRATCEYDINGNLVRIIWNYSDGVEEYMFQYDGNQVLIIYGRGWGGYYFIDTTICRINANGQLISEESAGSSRWSNEPQLRYYDVYSYDSEGNLTGITTNGIPLNIELIYSNTPSIYRHINAPDWFIRRSWVVYANYFMGKKGHMISEYKDERYEGGVEKWTYVLDADGYVQQLHWQSAYDSAVYETWLIEYVLAK